MIARERKLVVNADDFGLSPGVSEGILEAHARGIVTSASLMVRPASARESVVRSAEHPALSLGLHIDLGEWAWRNETWLPLYEVTAMHDERAVQDEIRRQLEAFHTMVGAQPTHLDSHQHVHAREPILSIAEEIAGELGVPLRHVTGGVRYCGRFYGQMADGTPLPALITAEALIDLVTELEPGATELACHPGYAGDLDTMYRTERATEVAVLCDARVRTAIDSAGVQLRSFGEIDR